MVSAAVKGLARLAYEFSDLVSTACNLLPSTFLLLQRKNKEIIKVSPFSLNYLIRSLFSLSLSLSLSPDLSL
jgi:ribosomal RNA-processing protein 12